MSDGSTFTPFTVFVRACEGCGRQVPLAEWQEGPLGCDDCRRRIVGVSSPRPGIVVLECSDDLAGVVVYNRYAAALDRVHGIGWSSRLREQGRAA